MCERESEKKKKKLEGAETAEDFFFFYGFGLDNHRTRESEIIDNAGVDADVEHGEQYHRVEDDPGDLIDLESDNIVSQRDDHDIQNEDDAHRENGFFNSVETPFQCFEIEQLRSYEGLQK